MSESWPIYLHQTLLNQSGWKPRVNEITSLNKTDHWVCTNMTNTTGARYGLSSSYPSDAPVIVPIFRVVSCSSVFNFLCCCIVHCCLYICILVGFFCVILLLCCQFVMKLWVWIPLVCIFRSSMRNIQHPFTNYVVI